MKRICATTQKEAINILKKAGQDFGGKNPRRWLTGNPPDSYEDEKYRIDFFVLEGSPPYGFIVCGINQINFIGTDREAYTKTGFLFDGGFNKMLKVYFREDEGVNWRKKGISKC